MRKYTTAHIFEFITQHRKKGLKNLSEIKEESIIKKKNNRIKVSLML